MDMMKGLGLGEGSHVSIEVNREQRELILKPIVVKKNTMPIDFVRILDKLVIDYEYTLRGLNK